MSKDLKTRKGKDGVYYPYTSPDLVIDENGKSSTKKFEEINTQFKDIATKTIIEGNKIHLAKSDGTKLDEGTDLPTITSDLQTYIEADNVAFQQNSASPNNPIWTQWNKRLSFGMDKNNAPVPFYIAGQLLTNGTIISRNNGNQQFNRWGFHVYEAYSKDNYSRMTVLLDKHSSEANKKPSLEIYYYTGSNHFASSYSNTKIGSDVAFHSFLFDRDKLTSYGEIDMYMPFTLARISLLNDINNTYETVAEADNAYEPENNYVENIKCLKYIALKNAKNGAMFYDTDREKAVIKINGEWCDLPTQVINHPSYSILGQKTTEIKCQSIELSFNDLTFVSKDSQTLIATVTPSDTTDNIKWSVSPTGICTVINGVITPITNGECIITATCGTKTATCSVTITGLTNNINTIDLWEVGVIGSGGNLISNDKRLRTKNYIPNNVTDIFVDDDYEYAIACYNDSDKVNGQTSINQGNCYYNFNDNNFTNSAVYITDSIKISNILANVGEYKNFKLILKRKNNNEVISIEESLKLFMYSI